MDAALHTLAIETSGTAGSVATLFAGKLVARLDLDPAGRSAKTLAPGIRQALAESGWKPADVQLVAVAHGPGSFTGLRLGVMTAKAFAYAVGAKLLGVGTLEVIAHRAPQDAPEIAVAVDAQRGEVYHARYRRAGNVLREVEPVGIVTAEQWIATLGAAVVVTGPSLVKLAARAAQVSTLAPRERWHPDAETVGRIAAARHDQDPVDELWSLLPHYLRRSAAEEKWDAQA